MATLTTPIYGFPSPDGAERVMDGDNAIGALALAVETALKTRSAAAPVRQEASGTLVLGTAFADIAGATYSASAIGAEVWLAIGVFDFQTTTLGASTVALGQCVYDGVAQSGVAAADAYALGRATTTQVWAFVAPVGGHVVKLQASKSNANGVVQVNATHSRLVVIRFGL